MPEPAGDDARMITFEEAAERGDFIQLERRPPAVLPADLDPECRELCEALNLLPGITTTESCCGHGRTPYRIFFTAASLDDLPAVCWCADRCHSGQEGWRVYVMTDCGMKPPDFILEGPAGAYAAAGKIAELARRVAADG